MEAISRGDHLILTNAYGEKVSGRALSGVVMGAQEAVVWVCAAEDWDDLAVEADHQAGVPWPLDAFELAPPA